MWYEYDQSKENNGKTAFVAKKNNSKKCCHEYHAYAKLTVDGIVLWKHK
jgi:hypothetical protein